MTGKIEECENKQSKKKTDTYCFGEKRQKTNSLKKNGHLLFRNSFSSIFPVKIILTGKIEENDLLVLRLSLL